MNRQTPKGLDYSALQLILLVTLRFMIGWHLLFGGISQLLDPDYTNALLLATSNGLLSGLYECLAAKSGMLHAVEVMNTWFLIIIGALLVLGLFTRAASGAGALLLLLYYLSVSPLIGTSYAALSGEDFLIVNKVLIESFALAVLAVFPTGHVIGLDQIRMRLRSR